MSGYPAPIFPTPQRVPPMSNLERQRRFRERNPGYYQRLHAKRRAQVEALHQQKLREKAIAQIIAPPEPMPLCLPAPEQVTSSWADRLIAEIRSARADGDWITRPTCAVSLVPARR